MRLTRLALTGILVLSAIALAGCGGGSPWSSASSSSGAAQPFGSGSPTVTPVADIMDGLDGSWTMKYTPISVTPPSKAGLANNTPRGWQCIVYNDDLTILMGNAQFKDKLKQIGGPKSKTWYFKAKMQNLNAEADEITTEIEITAELVSQIKFVGKQTTTVTSAAKGLVYKAKHKITGTRSAVVP